MALVADRVEVLSKHTITGTFGLYKQLLPTRLHASQKTHTSSEGEAWCRFCGKAPESVANILSGCRALAQSKYLSWHDSGTFLRDAAWSGTYRWSFTLILSSQAKACIRVGWRTSLLGRDSFCRSWRGEMQQSWRPNGQPQNQVGHYPRNELSVGQQQRKEERREDGKVCNPTLAIKTTVSWLRNETTQQHHWCPRGGGGGVATGDGHYNKGHCGGAEVKRCRKECIGTLNIALTCF